MFKYDKRSYPNPWTVADRANHLRDRGLLVDARKILRAALIEWPKNIFLYNKLLSLATNPEKAWATFMEIRASDAPVNGHTYRTLLNVYHKEEREHEIVEKLNPKKLPLEVIPSYCESLRRCKRYKRCIRWCNEVLSKSESKEAREHAWINRLYCYLQIDIQKFYEDISQPLILPTSLHYYRVVIAKICGRAYGNDEKPELKKILEKNLAKKISNSAKTEITKVLRLIS